MLERPKLFVTLKEFWVVISLLLVILLIRLFGLHTEYTTFKSKPFFYTDVQVLQAYEKWNENNYHTVLKLYSPVLNINFFSRTKIRAKDINSKIRLKLFPHEDMRFRDYLGTSFISSKVNTIYEEVPSSKYIFLNFIEKQHKNEQIYSFYKAIYVATPLLRTLREQVSKLGVSHLIALSGFHLAILSTVLFFLIRLGYRPLQQKFFPYRFDLYDIGFMVLIILAWYVWFVDAPPSLLRSYFMMFMAWILLVLGMELLSMSFLFTVVMLLLVIFPKLLLSLAFWFSVLGVFYIFLLLRYFEGVNRYLMTLFITFGIFFLMLPVVHTIFPLTTLFQLLSPFLSLLFTLFYPLSMVLHLLGVGSLLDPYLLQLFAVESEEIFYQLPLPYLYGYLALSFSAIFSKWLFYCLSLVALGFAIWLFSGFWVS